MLSKSLAVFPGSFDPLTRGHMDIVTRALGLFSQVTVAVLDNPDKKTLFTLDERVELVRDSFKDFGESVRVERFRGLLVDFMKKSGAGVIIRGLRAITDYDYEAQMALMNKHLCQDIETVFLVTSEEYSYISSSLVRQVASLGGDISNLVSPVVMEALRNKF
ncbi:MAG: pantetheine-phosphate adenylyltransferase [Candidatus Dadabacteria bacterium]|nr:MAG: pantetheine-phosphate adenylyltransferase [Candidatus Dadabacteria bacterium]